jgi:hypothetical protein
MKIGDVSRQRRFADPARQRWYAHHRAVRFAFHMTGRRPEQVSFPEPMSRFKEDDTELYYQESGPGHEPLAQVRGCVTSGRIGTSSSQPDLQVTEDIEESTRLPMRRGWKWIFVRFPEW